MPEVGVEPTRPEGHGILSWASDFGGSRWIGRFRSAIGNHAELRMFDLGGSLWLVLPQLLPQSSRGLWLALRLAACIACLSMRSSTTRFRLTSRWASN